MVNIMGLVLCGTLSVGKFVIHENQGNVLVAGDPIVEAVQYEQKQNWLGIMIAPSIIKNTRYLDSVINIPFTSDYWDALKHLIKDKTMHYYVYNINIPIKLPQISDEILEGLIIIPIDGIASKLNIRTRLIQTSNKLNVLKFSSPDSYTQKKYRETIEIYENILNRLSKVEEEFFIAIDDETDT